MVLGVGCLDEPSPGDPIRYGSVIKTIRSVAMLHIKTCVLTRFF